VATGRGLVVLDADTDEAVELVRELGVPDETPTVITPRGGRHFYLAGDGPTRTSVSAGLDVRGAGGCVVGAGSVGANGVSYTWDVPLWDADPAPVPTGVAELLCRKERRERAAGNVVRLLPPGTRNSGLTRMGGAMRRAGFAPDVIRDTLHAANRMQCTPPLPGREVDRIAASIAHMSGAPPWVEDPLRFAEDDRLDRTEAHLLLALALRARDDGTVRTGNWLNDVTRTHRNTRSNAVKALERHRRIRVQRARGKASVVTLLDVSAAPPTEHRGTACTSGVHEERAA
jgi:hypothetical protein